MRRPSRFQVCILSYWPARNSLLSSLTIRSTRNRHQEPAKHFFSKIRVARSVCFVDFFCLFVLFLLAIVLSVLLRFTDSNYPFDIFKLFLNKNSVCVLLLNCCLLLHTQLDAYLSWVPLTFRKDSSLRLPTYVSVTVNTRQIIPQNKFSFHISCHYSELSLQNTRPDAFKSNQNHIIWDDKRILFVLFIDLLTV